MDASLGLLLCTFLVVDEVGPETRPRGVCCLACRLWRVAPKVVQIFREKIARGRPTILNIVGDIGHGDIGQTRQPRKSKQSTHQYHWFNIRLGSFQAFFVWFRKCDRASHYGVEVLCCVRILFNTNSNRFVPQMWCYSSKCVDWQYQWRHVCLCPPMDNRQDTPSTTHSMLSKYWLAKGQSSTAS